MGTGEASGKKKKKEVGYVCVMTFSSILFGSPNSKANLKIISLFHSLFIIVHNKAAMLHTRKSFFLPSVGL